MKSTRLFLCVALAVVFAASTGCSKRDASTTGSAGGDASSAAPAASAPSAASGASQ
jgi:hypothetical protein